MADKNKQLQIGDKCLLVSRDYAYQNKRGGRILIAKVKTFCNYSGTVEPVFFEVGNSKRGEMTLAKYVVFVDLQEAIDSISIKISNY
jgi:hypothetical protein